MERSSSAVGNVVTDVLVMIKRNLVAYVRVPQLVVFSFVQPIMFVLLFAYVFGGAIETGISYINYLLPGILVQTVLFGALNTGVGLASDLNKGMIDRFRSLPMTRLAVLAGRTLADAIRNVFVLLLMLGIGFLIGFRVEGGLWPFVLAMLITMLFSFSFSWISATIGLAVKNVETVQSAGFIWVFPLVFASSIFVPIETMKPAIRAFAEYNPISYVVDTVRALSLGLPIGNELWYGLIWMVAILVVFIPLAVSRYRKIE